MKYEYELFENMSFICLQITEIHIELRNTFCY